MPNVQDTGWFLAGASTVIATLAGAIAALFKLLESKNADAIEALQRNVSAMEVKLDESDRRHDECQIDRAKLSVEVAILKEHMCRLVPPESSRGEE